MDEQTLLREFELLVDAPNAVPKLREMILDLAVRGRLVPQDSSDEPVDHLALRSFERTKQRMIDQGLGTQMKQAGGISDDEIPHAVPSTWRWVRLSTICCYIQRGRSPKYSTEEEVPVVSQKCVQWTGFDISPARYIDPATLDKYQSYRFLRAGDLLWNSTGHGTLGRIIEYDPRSVQHDRVVVDSHVTVVRPLLSHILSRYLFIWFAGPTVQSEINDRSSGSTKQTELATSTVQAYLVPLPPLPEQRRIVAKVDELMRLCDELESRQEKRKSVRVSLNTSALDALQKADKEAVQGRWQFVRDHFDLLYQHPQNVQKLKETILQLAVQGKLTRQDPTDEPASELLKRIEAEKQRLYEEGKIRKPKKLPPVKEEEMPFELPRGWEWVALGQIADNIHYGHTASAAHGHTGVRFVRITDIQDGRVDWSSVPGCEIAEKDVGKYELNENDILIARTGGTIGKSFLLKEVSHRAVFASYLIRVVPSTRLCASYVKQFLDSPGYWDQLRGYSKGTGQPNVNATSLSQLAVPLPPLPEQHRIVVKVDELMRLCHELEQGLKRSEAKAEKMLEAVLTTVTQSQKPDADKFQQITA